MAMPVTRYAKSGDVHIAYQVFGSRPINLVVVPGFVSHIENYWDHPDLARWLLRLSSFARVAIFDKRGTGLSDRVLEAPSLDHRMDDARGRSIGGVGLGLAITDQAVRLHGGSVKASNLPEGGLLVEIRLPLQFVGGVSNEQRAPVVAKV